MAAPLEERFYETQRAQLLRWLPWLHLFRAFRIALDARKILLGAMAVLALSAGDALINALPFAPSDGSHSEILYVATPDVLLRIPGFDIDVTRSAAGTSFWSTAPWNVILFPATSIVEPGWRLFRRGNTWADAAYAWTQLLFRLAVWSLLGGAIARMAAVQFARRETVTARAAARYAAARFGSIIGAPLLPLVFIGFFWIICLALGLIGRLPGIGPVIVGSLWFLPLLIGIALAVILLVIAVSWPIMVATISAEGTDAFDGLSRGYDYVLNRTWYALWLLLLTVVYGTIVVTFVAVIATQGTRLAAWSVASGMGVDNLDALVSSSPSALFADHVRFGTGASASLGQSAARFWLRGLSWLLQGFVISYFWTAVTIVYLLLRLSLDAKPLDEVFVPASPNPEDALPLVGIPASERREQERGASSTGEPDPADASNGNSR